jgi:hypothetical protein
MHQAQRKAIELAPPGIIGRIDVVARQPGVSLG